MEKIRKSQNDARILYNWQRKRWENYLSHYFFPDLRDTQNNLVLGSKCPRWKTFADQAISLSLAMFYPTSLGSNAFSLSHIQHCSVTWSWRYSNSPPIKCYVFNTIAARHMYQCHRWNIKLEEPPEDYSTAIAPGVDGRGSVETHGTILFENLRR